MQSTGKTHPVTFPNLSAYQPHHHKDTHPPSHPLNPTQHLSLSLSLSLLFTNHCKKKKNQSNPTNKKKTEKKRKKNQTLKKIPQNNQTLKKCNSTIQFHEYGQLSLSVSVWHYWLNMNLANHHHAYVTSFEFSNRF